ncbi:MAG: glycosyltransferase 87 family protein, partial [Myxococcota bacterium]
ITHMNFLQGQRELPRRGWDFYHYYIGPKYFAELGHTGLYRAHTVADYEDDRESYHPEVWVRVLEDYSLTHKAIIVARREEVVAGFSPERWQEFKSDVGAFRHADFDVRQEPRWAQDHGYNGSPLTTVINRWLIHVLPFTVAEFVRVVSWFDLLLVVAAALITGRALGARWGLFSIIMFSLNPLNNYLTIGGSYLRYVHYVSLALGIVALLRGRNATSGVLFAISTHLRLFPVLLPLALFVGHLLSPERRSLLRARRSFYVSFAATGVLLLGLTSFVGVPGGEPVWKAFFENSRLHSRVDSVNQVTLRYPFRYSEQANREVEQRTAKAIEWSAEIRRTFERNASWFYLAVTGFVALSIVFLRRVHRDEEALFAGLVWLFACTHISVYDYLVLSVVPLIFYADRRMWQLLTLSWIVIGAINFLPAARESMDWGYRAISIVVAIYFATALAVRAFAWRGPSAGALPGTVAGTALQE